MISILKSIIKPFLAYALLMINPIAVTLSVVQLVLSLFLLVCFYIYDRGILKVRFTLSSFNKPLAKDMLTFSFFLIVIAIVDQMYWQAGKLFLGALVGTASVAIFSFAVQITQQYVTISSSLSVLIFPKVSKLVVAIDKNIDELNTLFIRYSRIQIIVLGLILSGFILFGKQFIALWIGQKYELVYYLTLSFMVPFTWDLTQNFGLLVLNAMNLHRYRAFLYFIVVLLYIAVCYPVIKTYGVIGCAILSGVCILIGNGLGLSVLYSKIGHLRMRSYFYWLIRIIPIAIIALGFGVMIITSIPVISWRGLILQGLVFCIVYAIGVFFLYLSKLERTAIIAFISRHVVRTKHSDY
jgi:O-antigen/teichoic acid export membrane protein